MHNNILLNIKKDENIKINWIEYIIHKMYNMFSTFISYTLLFVIGISFILYKFRYEQEYIDYSTWLNLYSTPIFLIIIISNAIWIFLPFTFCFYQKHIAKNEDFKKIKYDNFLHVSKNFMIILYYYFWKKKFKNTRCFIENDIFYLTCNSTHAMLENFEALSKNPVNTSILKGKMFITNFKV